MKKLYNEIHEWMGRCKRNSVKATTYDRLETSLDMLEKHSIADVCVDDLTTERIQKYINDLVDEGYSLSTIKKQYHLIGAFIEHCNLNGTILRPLHKGVYLPSESAVSKHKKEVVAYTRSEQRALRKVLMRGDSPAFYAAIIMLETGMRVGEILALGWDDIDWRRKAVRISKTAVRIANRKIMTVQKGAKSFTSNRTIPLSNDAYELLDHMREFDTSDSCFVFHNREGKMLSYEILRWWIRKACDEAGVPYYGQHVFRHTFATNCYENGCDVKVLSKFLGHSDVTITYNVYIHLFGDALEEMRLILS